MTARLVAAAVLVLALAAVTGVFARRLRRYSRLRWWVNVLIPGMQAVIMAFLLVCFIMTDVPTWFYVLVVASGGLCVVVDVALVKELNAAEEKDLVEERERVLSEQVELQAEHLARLEADAADARNARADIAERFERVARALDAAEAAEASGEGVPGASAVVSRQLKDAATWAHAQTVSSGHPVVDALLDAKLDLCSQLDIKTDFVLQVPCDLAVENVDLCAVFSNVMDNAIAACAQVTPASRRFITRRARVASGFLMLEASNSCLSVLEEGRAEEEGAASSSSPFREHGWGTIILGAIAERYDGTFEAKRMGREFRTLVALKVVG